jgi:hypothetical protein
MLTKAYALDAVRALSCVLTVLYEKTIKELHGLMMSYAKAAEYALQVAQKKP